MRRSILTCKGVKAQAGDYVESQLAERMDRAEAGRRHRHPLAQVRRAPEDRLLRGQRRALAFICATSSSTPACAPSTSTARTPKPERDASLARLASGEIELITNCMVLTEGWDMPEVGCCILARPTKKMGLYRQMIGRVLRPAEGKPDAIILDHSGAVYRHGFAEDRVEWTLDPDTARREPGAYRAAARREAQSRLLECTQCGCDPHRRRSRAAHCGFLPTPPPRPFTIGDGDLGLVEGRPRQSRRLRSAPQRDATGIGMLDRHRARARLQAGLGRRQVQGEIRHLAAIRRASLEPIEPTPEVRSWVRSRLIAYAKGKARGSAA